MTSAVTSTGNPSNQTPTQPLTFSQHLSGMFMGNSKVPLVIAGGLFLSIIVMLLLWAGAPEYRIIYNNLSAADGGKVVAELEKRGIKYQIGAGGQTISVPAKEVHSLRLQLAEQGLPEGTGVGFELMDNQSFGISQFAEHINFQRGLEGELSRSVESLGPVNKARVHLVMAKASVFARDKEPARASVVLHLHPGRELSKSHVDAIAHMISSSVPSLPVNAVTVVDQAGRLLSTSGDAEGLDGTQLTYTEEVEKSYQRRIENILSPLFGDRNIKAQVVAQIDFSSREQTAERYGPNQPPNEAAIRSQQVSENLSGDAEFARGVPGALTNSPPYSPAITTPDGQAVENTEGANAIADVAGTQGSFNRDKMINYEVDRNIEHVQHRRGGVTRLSAAVVVNYRYVEDDEGELVATPLTEAEMANINRLVRQAMGFSAQRGDEIAVINSPFSITEEIVDKIEWWQTSIFIDLMKTVGRYLLVAIVAFILWRIIVKPLVRKQSDLLDAQKALLTPPVAASVAREAEGADSEEGLGNQELINGIRRKKPSYDANLKGFIAMAQEEPRMVASVLHKWINS